MVKMWIADLNISRVFCLARFGYCVCGLLVKAAWCGCRGSPAVMSRGRCRHFQEPQEAVPFLEECWQGPTIKRALCRTLAYVGCPTNINMGIANPMRLTDKSNKSLILVYIWRYSWCYNRRKWTWRHAFKTWTRLIAFHIALIPLGKVWIQLFSLQLWVNSRAD